MDFPDVSLVVQAGLPLNTDAYTHRVGRTARAGKGGRAVIVLTEGESFYLKVNRQFPITPYPATEKVVNDDNSEATVEQAMEGIDEKTKQKAYSAYLGFMKPFENKLGIDSKQLVQMSNQFAMRGMGCPEPPGMEKRTIGKMGLKGVPGIRYVRPQSKERTVQSEDPPATYSSALRKRPGIPNLPASEIPPKTSGQSNRSKRQRQGKQSQNTAGAAS
ncbi:MAG: hypothetical protein Q9181_004294 [Wetmoreana brouardii]